MTNTKQYFKAYLRQNLKFITIVLALVIIVSFIWGLNDQPVKYRDHGTYVIYYTSTLSIPMYVLILFSIVLPVKEFSFFKKRINLDCAYSLPISRKAMGVVHYLVGCIMLWGVYTASYLTNFILMLSRGAGYFNYTPMIEHYFLCLFLGMATYSVFVFVFNEANTRGDGIWFMLLYSLVVYVIIQGLRVAHVLDYKYHIEAEYSLSSYLLENITSHYEKLVEIARVRKTSFWDKQDCLWYAYWMVLWAASAIGTYFTFGKRRMEKTEEVSDSFWGFRTLIPIYACFVIMMMGTVDLMSLVFIEVFAVIGYVIYRRGFHFKKSDFIVLAAILVYGILKVYLEK
jgi:hypothetical protein